MTYNLFIDDERWPPEDGRKWVIARNWRDVWYHLERNGMPEFISFDHDLGDNEFTGYVIAKRLCDIDMNDELPSFSETFDYYVHSQNPVGKENIEKYLDNYLEFKKSEKG